MFLILDDAEMIFSLEEDPAEDNNIQETGNSALNFPNTTSLVATLLHKARPKSPMRMKSHLFPRPKHVGH